ncbi:uncharacterized protein LOC129222180 [Uloborus diversus]|uniref:uncharacterized protein LOC129222180 n=1 Tax=Uloborus diversus TaxID=327109 RepID=UPI00240A91A4|nr:uncharacterized protein LOC129222180 [Uloborus diversus]
MFILLYFSPSHGMDVERKTKKSEAFKNENTTPFWIIDKQMLPFKIHYVLFFGGIGAISPYIAVVAKNRLGLTATALGAVFTSYQLLLIFSKPIIGFITDYFNKLKWIIIILTLIQGVFYFLLLPIPRITSSDTEPICNISEIANRCLIRTVNSTTSPVQDGKNFSHSYDPGINSFDDCCSKHSQHKNKSENYSSTENENVFQTYQFWLFTLFLIISQTCTDALFTLSDTACYEILQNTKSDFGRQRLWGAMSWGIIAPIAGFLNDFTNSYYPSWSIMAILTALQLWNLARVDLVKPQPSQNILKDIRNVLGSLEFIAFLGGVLMNGMATSLIWFHLSWFFVSLGGNRLLVGLSQTIQCFVEIPFMFFSNNVIERLKHFNVVTLALFCHGIRFFWYSYFQNPWFMLPIESLHGLTYGVYFPAMTAYGKSNSKPGMEATIQSVLAASYEGGAGLGCVLSGIAFDRFGGQTTFFYAGIFCSLASLINIASTIVINRRNVSLEITTSTA